MQDASNTLYVLILGEKVCLQCWCKLVITKHWVMETVRQRVPGHRADNRKCSTTKWPSDCGCHHRTFSHSPPYVTEAC